MPHLTCEYSANLGAAVDMQSLCDALSGALQATGLFELGAIRVRARRCEAWSIADGHGTNAFLDASLRIGAGRTLEQKQRAGEVIFAVLGALLAPQLATPHFALSFEIREIDPALSWKKNAIHPRLATP